MRYARLYLLLLFVLTFTSGGASALLEAHDSIPGELAGAPVCPSGVFEAARGDAVVSAEPENRNWWYLFKKGKLKMDDPTVKWPKFLGFCVKVYNWGDRVFSTTDPDYVVGTGKKWRARIINDNWANSYYMKINPEFNSIMSTPFHVLLGASIQYMAVSYTYSLDMT
ncbi:MAG: hypothetical protein K2L00_00325, partial [Muribaculaceae bacterium]|nr:hypothetical protein [Muribaculaceae bacterium]